VDGTETGTVIVNGNGKNIRLDRESATEHVRPLGVVEITHRGNVRRTRRRAEEESAR